MPPKKATKSKASPMKEKPGEEAKTADEEKPMETDEKAEEHVEEGDGEEEADGGDEEKVTNEEYAISNAMRAKASDKAGRIEKDGMVEVWVWGRPYSANREGTGMVQLEHVRPIDFYNPFIYAAIQNASQINYESFLKPPTKDSYFDANNLSDGKLTLHYRTDLSSRHMQNNFFRFIRTPGHKIVVKRSVPTRKQGGAAFRKQVDLPGVMIDVPLPMRSLVVRGIPDDADLAKVIAALPHATEAMIEKHEIRKDERGNNCALISFKEAEDAIKTHMQAVNVKFTDGQAEPTKVYYQAASVFYDSLLHVYEKKPEETKNKYAVMMRPTDHKYASAEAAKKPATQQQGGNKRTAAKANVGHEEGMTPSTAKKLKQQIETQQKQKQQRIGGPRSNDRGQQQRPAGRPQRGLSQPSRGGGRMNNSGSFRNQNDSFRSDNRRGRQNTMQQGGDRTRGRSAGGRFEKFDSSRQQQRGFGGNNGRGSGGFSNNSFGGGFDDALAIQQRLLEQQTMIRTLQQQVSQQDAMSSAMRNLQQSLTAGQSTGGFGTAARAYSSTLGGGNQGWGGPSMSTRSSLYGSR